MRRRLLTAMLLIAALAVAGFGLPLALSARALYGDEALLLLSEEAARAAVAVPASFARDRDLPELPTSARGVDVALYDATGRRVVGTGPDRADDAVNAALHGRTVQHRRTNLVVARPISDEETVVGAVRAGTPADVVVNRTRRTWAAMTGLAVAVLAVAGLLAAHRSKSLARPLARLRADADVLGGGGELLPRPATGIIEIDAVHGALADAARRRNGALARERSFSADLAHQLRTPLASLRLRLETEQLHSDRDHPLLAELLTDVERLQVTIDDLLTLARDTDRTREPYALSTLLRDTISRWTPRLADLNRQLVVDIAPQLPWVEASPAAIRQILDVLIDNAARHGDGDVQLTATRTGQGVVVAVADHGTAVVSTEHLYLRRNPQATGSGIGLALARRLADAEDLSLVLADPGPGAIFHLVFGPRPHP